MKIVKILFKNKTKLKAFFFIQNRELNYFDALLCNSLTKGSQNYIIGLKGVHTPCQEHYIQYRTCFCCTNSETLPLKKHYEMHLNQTVSKSLKLTI